jgi:hypothetical protein
MEAETRELHQLEGSPSLMNGATPFEQAKDEHSHGGDDEHNVREEGVDEEGYISGFRLTSVLVAGTLVQFVMMLDQSIIATV